MSYSCTPKQRPHTHTERTDVSGGRVDKTFCNTFASTNSYARWPDSKAHWLVLSPSLWDALALLRMLRVGTYRKVRRASEDMLEVMGELQGDGYC